MLLKKDMLGNPVDIVSLTSTHLFSEKVAKLLKTKVAHLCWKIAPPLYEGKTARRSEFDQRTAGKAGDQKDTSKEAHLRARVNKCKLTQQVSMSKKKLQR